MNIKEVKEKRQKLERDIESLLVKFEYTTGVSIEDIKIVCIQQPDGRTFLAVVNITLSI